MSDFSQNGIISSLHDFGTKSTKDIEKDLLKFSKERKMELILPSLYSELEGDALPRIVSEISKVNYLSHIIIGLDRANKKQADKAHKFFKKLKTPFSIGPKSKDIESQRVKDTSVCTSVNRTIRTANPNATAERPMNFIFLFNPKFLALRIFIQSSRKPTSPAPRIASITKSPERV